MIVGPSIGTYGSGRSWFVGRAVPLRTRSKPGASAACVRASALQAASVSGPMPSVSGKLPARCEQRGDVIEATAGLHRRERRRVDAHGELERSAPICQIQETRRGCEALASCGSTTTIHVTNVLCMTLVP